METISILSKLFFGPIIFNFFFCCPLPYSLSSGSSARTLRRGRQAKFWVRKRTLKKKRSPKYSNFAWVFSSKCFIWWDWWVIKSVLYFFSFCDILNTILVYILIHKRKMSGQISCGFIFWSSWRVAPTIFKITLLRRHFSKMSLKVDFLEKNNKDFPLK